MVISDQEIAPDKRQGIATGVALSETAFVQRLGRQVISLRFHTPNREILNCGHATLAALRLMRDKGFIEDGDVQFSTQAFVGRATINGQYIFMSQAAPVFEEFHEIDRLADSIGLDKSYVSGSPAIVSTGNRFLIIPIKNKGALKGIKPNDQDIKAISEEFNLIGYYAFAVSRYRRHVAYARMFAPAYGIPEESATGMAAGALAGYLNHNNRTPNNHYEFYQGELMPSPSPSRLIVALDRKDNQIREVSVGGEVRYVSKRTIKI